MRQGLPRYPGRAPIEAYGNGGFRFAGMSHKGSILCLADAIIAWGPADLAEVTVDALAPLITDPQGIELLLLGAGHAPAVLSAGLRDALRSAGVRVEVMDTGAAARTYNVLLAEQRPVAAALIAVT